MKSFVDCQAFDEGYVIEYWCPRQTRSLMSFLHRNCRDLSAAKAPFGDNRPKSVKSVPFSPEVIANNLLELRDVLVDRFSSSSSHFLVKFRTFDVVDKLTEGFTQRPGVGMRDRSGGKGGAIIDGIRGRAV